jgi:hypothetical protein
VNKHPQYKAATTSVNILSKYIKNKDPKELNSLSKEMRNLILKDIDEQT